MKAALGAVARRQLEAEHAAIEGERPLDVGHLQVDVADARARIDRRAERGLRNAGLHVRVQHAANLGAAGRGGQRPIGGQSVPGNSAAEGGCDIGKGQSVASRRPRLPSAHAIRRPRGGAHTTGKPVLMNKEHLEVARYDHPGRGGRARPVPKGRQVDPRASEEVLALLGDRPRRRDLLIEHLHLIQDAYHQISAAHLAALADEMRISLAEAYETATFYAHFDVVKEGDAPVPPLTVRVCDSLTCAMLGGEELLAELQGSLVHRAQDVRVVRAPCVGLCDHAPAAEVGHNFLHNATVRGVHDAIERHDTHPHIPDYVDYDAYVAGGGYQLLQRVRSGALAIDDILKILDDSALRGLGGAGFPTGRKWRSVRGEPGPRLMAVNGDEGEPGTFKDRFYLYSDPHRFLEGMLIGAHVVEAADVYVYLRDEYPIGREILIRELAKLPPGLPRIHLRRGAGAYICGEESSMLEIDRGQARLSAPQAALSRSRSACSASRR